MALKSGFSKDIKLINAVSERRLKWCGITFWVINQTSLYKIKIKIQTIQDFKRWVIIRGFILEACPCRSTSFVLLNNFYMFRQQSRDYRSSNSSSMYRGITKICFEKWMPARNILGQWYNICRGSEWDPSPSATASKWTRGFSDKHSIRRVQIVIFDFRLEETKIGGM